MSDQFEIRIDLEGDREIQKALSQMSNKIHKKVLRGTIRTAMKPALAESKRMVPVESGALRDSLKISVKAFPPYVFFGAVWVDKRFTRWFGGKMRRPINYAWLVEHGHDVVRGGVVIATVPPQAFIRDAFAVTKDEIIRTFRKSFIRGAKREWRKMTDGPKVKRRVA